MTNGEKESLSSRIPVLKLMEEEQRIYKDADYEHVVCGESMSETEKMKKYVYCMCVCDESVMPLGTRDTEEE